MHGSHQFSNSFDYNDANGGTSFKACHKEWRQYQMMDDFSKWGVQSFSESKFHLEEKYPDVLAFQTPR
jgi:hypothetical protein